MIKIIHTADNHLRSAQYSRTSRGIDFKNALFQVLDIAKAEKAEAIIIAGDLIDTTRPAPNVVGDVVEFHNLAMDAKIPVLLTAGNHDYTDPHWAKATIRNTTPYGIHLLDHALYTLPSGITVYGVPFMGPAAFRAYKEEGGFKPADILVWHGMVVDMVSGFQVKDALTTEDFKSLPYQYGALGDIHVPTVNRNAGFPLVYPGSTENCSAGEPLDKSVFVLEFNDDRKLHNFNIHPIKTRKLIPLRIHSEEDLTRALEALKKHKDENPIVLGSYEASLADTCKRVYSILDPDKCIIRLEPVFNRGPDLVNTADVPMRNPIEFVGDYFAPNTKIYDVACRLTDDKANVVEILSNYIDTRLEDISKAV